MKAESYTIGQVSRLAHVTVRTLHHYDEIGLLVPSARSGSGYRLYSQADLDLLRRILILRQLDLPLESIRQLIAARDEDVCAALLQHRARLHYALERNQAVLRAVDSMIHEIERGKSMNTKDMFDGFDQFDHSKYEDEARERWGHTEAYNESARRTRNYSKADFARIKAEGNALIARMAEVMHAGRKAEDSEAVDIAEEMRLQIDRWFYPCDRTMHEKLGEMYVSDARFTEVYESHAEGLAEFVAAAIKANARR